MLTRQARLLRRRYRRFAQLLRYRRLTLAGVPILFANSFPKSGTHLLTQVLNGFTNFGPAVDSGMPAIVTFDGRTGRQRSASEILIDLKNLLPGDIAYGHVHAFSEAVEFFVQDSVAAFFIFRDPRDVVLSHVHYVTEMEPGHIHHRYYTEGLQSFHERLRTSITGLSDSNLSFPDIKARFEPYLDWLDQSQVLSLQFERFIDDRDNALCQVYDHAVERGFPEIESRDVAVNILKMSINPKRSPTYRSGKIGGWSTRFNEENKCLFKEVAGELLIRLGYEVNNDW
ncbi:MAG: hypothetical protein PVF74_03810 [Anaerolineales bacterium]|jgi:hypothetical protein